MKQQSLFEHEMVVDSFLSISIFAEGGGRKSTHGLINYNLGHRYEKFSLLTFVSILTIIPEQSP